MYVLVYGFANGRYSVAFLNNLIEFINFVIKMWSFSPELSYPPLTFLFPSQGFLMPFFSKFLILCNDYSGWLSVSCLYLYIYLFWVFLGNSFWNLELVKKKDILTVFEISIGRFSALFICYKIQLWKFMINSIQESKSTHFYVSVKLFPNELGVIW